MRPFVCLHVLGGEVGAVLLEEGKVRDRLRVPSDALPSLEAFVSGRPVVAHSWDLVRGIEDRRTRMGRFGAWRGPVWEVEALARTVRWWAGDYGLGALGVRKDDVLSAAEGLASVFSELLDELSSKEPKVLERMAYVAHGTELEEVFLEALRRSAGFPSRIGGRKLEPPKALSPREPPEEVPEEAVEEVLGEGGVCSQRLSGYEHRPQQVLMAKAVCRAFNKGEVILAEAGTGTGKSLAYLVPAVLWCAANDDRTVVSTHTKNLQDQLFQKDIPLLAEALGFDFKAVLLKGRGNYLCLFEYYELLKEAARSYPYEQRQALLPLVVWAETTKTGDIAECSGFNISRNRQIWTRISCEGSFCLGRQCPYYSRCFIIRARNEALTAHLRVINHHLFFADFAADGDLIRISGHAILDEAHNLEKVAAAYLGQEINYYQFSLLFNKIYAKKPMESGFLMLLKHKTVGLDESESRRLDSLAATVRERLAVARRSLFDFFEAIAVSLAGKNRGAPTARETSYENLSRFVSPEVTDTADEALKSLQSALTGLSDELELTESCKDNKLLAVKCRALAADLVDLKNAFEFLAYPGDKEYVYWLELWRKKDTKLASAPLEVGKLLDERLYDRLKTLVLCSATLSVAGDFTFFCKRLGLDRSSSERTFWQALDSPFALAENVGFFEAGYLPAPNSREFASQTAVTVKTLFETARVKGMVLFTSYAAMADVVSAVGEQLIAAGFELFIQDSSLSPYRLLSRYRQSSAGIIFGTDSFWEGVDLPGAELELLIIVKLPFAVPDRPWIKANLDKITENGGNAFMEYSLPEAVIKFRQGFGRLIRKKTDRGCIVVLDSRLGTKRYGRYFADSVKPPLKRCRSLKSLAKSVKNHFMVK